MFRMTRSERKERRQKFRRRRERRRGNRDKGGEVGTAVCHERAQVLETGCWYKENMEQARSSVKEMRDQQTKLNVQ